MFFSTSNPVHNNRFDMLDPSADSNHLNEFPLVSSNANFDEPNFDELIDMNAGQSYSGYGNLLQIQPPLQSMVQASQPIPFNYPNNSQFNNKMFSTIDNDIFNSSNNFSNTAEPSLLSSSSINSFMDNSTFFNNDNYFSSPPQLQSQPPLISVNSFDIGQQRFTPPTTINSIPEVNTYSQLPQSVKKETQDVHDTPVNSNGKRRYRVVRGISAGGCSTRPPKQSIESDSIFLPVELDLIGATVEDICYPKWSLLEKEDRRRIIRIERIQNGPKLIANFSLVGSANENPTSLPPPPNVDVVEVSCLECSVKFNDDYESSDDENKISSSNCIKNEVDGEVYQYYITSVEVVEIVELLIGTQSKDPAERRRERGRVRSNLVPFWSKKPISSRMNDTSNSTSPIPSSPTNQDFRVELAKRIMGYEIRKPRGFDKEVRILRWDKLIPALKRALQSYYTEIPRCDVHLEFN